LYRNPFIKKFVAGILLLVFAVSVTPRQFFHDIITGHKHSYTKYEDVLKIQPTKSTFQCNWQNDAVESPFTDQPCLQVDPPFRVYSSYVNGYTFSYYSAEQFFSSLRGPPALG
jgi:hypothetical protein